MVGDRVLCATAYLSHPCCDRCTERAEHLRHDRRLDQQQKASKVEEQLSKDLRSMAVAFLTKGCEERT